ncbi:MAG: hypothetical protein JSR99_01440 [Proteobacteria bacterium]|nr:hypothetical protein [Pseudomonadota bacterium]
MSEDLPNDARDAYIFSDESRHVFAVSLDRGGRNLPNAETGNWTFVEEFPLGVHEVMPYGIDPEPVLRGLAADGYFVWPAHVILPFGTSQ